jgi:hypothetical protein
MRSGDPAGPADRADHLAGSHGISSTHIDPAQVEVPGHEPRAVVEIDRLPRQVERRHQSHHSPIRRPHWRAHLSRKVGSEMSGRHLAVELAGGAEPAGHLARARRSERAAPQSWVRVRFARERASLFDLRVDPRLDRAVGLDESRRDGEALAGVDRLADRELDHAGVGPGRPGDHQRECQGVPAVERNSGE